MTRDDRGEDPDPDGTGGDPARSDRREDVRGPGGNADPAANDRRDPVVRPLGFVSDRPIVRRIGNRDLYLGNHHAADPDSLRETGVPDSLREASVGASGGADAVDGIEASDPGASPFEYVLSLTHDPRPLTTHHHPLDDGSDNTWREFAGAVDAARELLDEEGSLLVHCKAGVSRSTAVIATALAAEEERSFREALELVQESRPFATPHPALHQRAVIYLAARG